MSGQQVHVVCVVCNGKKQVVTGHTSICCMEGMPKSPVGEREQWLTRRCEECQPTYVPKLETSNACTAHASGREQRPESLSMNAVSPSDFERDRLVARIVTSLPTLSTGSLHVVAAEIAHYIEVEKIPLDLPPGVDVDGLNRLLQRIDLDERGRRAAGPLSVPPPSPGPWMIAKVRDQDFDFIVPADESEDEEGSDRTRGEAVRWTTQAELAAIFLDHPSAVSVLDLLRIDEPGEVFQIHPAARWGRK